MNWNLWLGVVRKSSGCQISSVVVRSLIQPTSGEWKHGVDPHTFNWNLLQDIILQEAMDGSHHHLITNILPLDTTDPDSDWKDVIKQTCVRILMQMAGSVCSSAQNYHFLHLHLPLTNVLKKHFLLSFPWNTWSSSWSSQEHTINHFVPCHHIVFHLQNVLWLRHILCRSPPQSWPVKLWSQCGADQTVTQHLWRQLHIQGWGGPGKEPLVLEEMVHFEKKFLY